MPAEQASRRGFLGLLTKALLSVLGILVAVPGVAYFIGPLRKRDGTGSSSLLFLDAGPVADFPVEKWRLVNVELVRENGWEKSRVRRSVWVNRQKEPGNSFTVLSPICPHLGCPVNLQPDKARFVCPCHGGIFDQKGQVQSGPPPRGLDSLEHEIRAGRLWVKWQDFKVGVQERIPVSV
jgi:menaquinol-cytochrome c reductase iron-sulfur subunit